MSENRRLAAILAADVVGYSKMMGDDEAGTLSRVRSLRTDLIEPKIAEHKGRLFKAMGDGFLVEFSSVVNAVACAVSIQNALANPNAEQPEGQAIQLRIGVNLGDVIAEGDDIFGEGVNVAARLEGVALPGSVVVSMAARDQIGARLDLGFEDIGELALKNIAKPIRAFRVAPATPAVSEVRPKQAGEDLPSIAVLPFDNMSSDPEQEYFADGIAEDLLTELSRQKDLAAVSRNSSFVYKGKSISAQQAGRELGADFLLEGSVRKSGSRVRITAQLIDCSSGKHVWAERYDRNLEDIFALQDEIVSDILTGLAFNLTGAAASQRLRKPTSSANAYNAFLQARAAWDASNEELALKHLRNAIEIDPDYAEALAYLASMLAYSYFSGASGFSSSENKRLCREYAARALSIDKQNADVLTSVALAKCMIGETAEARPLIAAAREMMPRDPPTMVVEGEILTYSGDHERGLALIETAVRREPRLPITYKMAMAECNYLARNYEKALQIFDSVFDMPWYSALMRSACLGQLGRGEAARSASVDAMKRAPPVADPAEFARNIAGMCVLEEDAENWLEGFRKAGVAV